LSDLQLSAPEDSASRRVCMWCTCTIKLRDVPVRQEVMMQGLKIWLGFTSVSH